MASSCHGQSLLIKYVQAVPCSKFQSINFVSDNYVSVNYVSVNYVSDNFVSVNLHVVQISQMSAK